MVVQAMELTDMPISCAKCGTAGAARVPTTRDGW
jgi:hypothetical protein